MEAGDVVVAQAQVAGPALIKGAVEVGAVHRGVQPRVDLVRVMVDESER